MAEIYQKVIGVFNEGKRESGGSMNWDLIPSVKPHTSDVMLGSK